MNFILRLIDLAFKLYTYGLIAYILLSWVNSPESDRLKRWLGRFYIPPLSFIQRGVRPVRVGMVMIDPSPLILLIGVILAKMIVFDILSVFT